MNEKMRNFFRRLREWWKRATTEDEKCLRCGCCGNVCKLVGLKDKPGKTREE